MPATIASGLTQAAALAAAAGMPLMAVNDVLYHAAERRPLQDVLTAIRLNVTGRRGRLRAQGQCRAAPEDRPTRWRGCSASHPEALAETLRFAGELSFSLNELKHNYPDETTEEGVDPQTGAGAADLGGRAHRYPGGIPEKVSELLRHELGIVASKNYARYFLTVHDIVRHARSKEVGILCQGRGSAANSVDLLLPAASPMSIPTRMRRPVRALHLGRARRAARHRCRFRA